MAQWIDLALLPSEEELTRALEELSGEERSTILSQLHAVLRLRTDSAERAMLRLMIERARPIVLSASLWSRPIESSTNIVAETERHFKYLGIQVTRERVQAAQGLYAQFVADRGRHQISQQLLEQQGYRCMHCGLAFCDEELSQKGFVSPFGSRRRPKQDSLKPHWRKLEDRLPTMDHHWPVTLYGDNRSDNHRILCRGCNLGKEQYLAAEQMRPFVGLPRREQFMGHGPIPFELFYAQIRLYPDCVRTGKTAKDTELTVELRDPRLVGVLDNLITVESAGL
jgi:hypothetical protein